jgi:HEAT repeat protein
VNERPPKAALSHPDPRVRFAALEQLREHAMADPGDTVLASAIADATRDPDWDVRESALYTLRFFAVDTARAALIAAAQDPGLDTTLRGLATESLGGTGGGPKVEQALLALLSDPLPELRFWAAHSLGAVGDRAAVAPLAALLTQPDAALTPYGTLHEEARAAIEAIRSRETDG